MPPRKRARTWSSTVARLEQAVESRPFVDLSLSSERTPDWLRDACVSLWCNEKLCDLKILVGGKVFLAQRLVLAAASSYFRARLTNGNFVEADDEHISLPELNEHAFQHVLEFIYKRKCVCDEELLQPILETACRLQLHELQKVAESAVIARLTPAICLDAWEFADRLSLIALTVAAKNIALSSFEEVSRSAAFGSIDRSRLTELLADDALNVSSEPQAFRALERWVEAQPEPPAAETVEDLLAHVRFPLITCEQARRELQGTPLGRRHTAALESALVDASHADETGTGASVLDPRVERHWRKRLCFASELRGGTVVERWDRLGDERVNTCSYAGIVVTAKHALLISRLSVRVCSAAQGSLALFHKPGDHSDVSPFDLKSKDGWTQLEVGVGAHGGGGGEAEADLQHAVFSALHLSLQAGETHTLAMWGHSGTQVVHHTGLGYLPQEKDRVPQMEATPGFADAVELKRSQTFFPVLELTVRCC